MSACICARWPYTANLDCPAEGHAAFARWLREENEREECRRHEAWRRGYAAAVEQVRLGARVTGSDVLDGMALVLERQRDEAEARAVALNQERNDA